MNSHPHDEAWPNLLRAAAPAYAAPDDAPPLGFTTRVAARLRAQDREREQLEKIGWRALLASLAILLLTAGVALGLSERPGDLEPGLSGLLQGATEPLS
jgi:hypothetical protein